jgi:hypothetical protein
MNVLNIVFQKKVSIIELRIVLASSACRHLLIVENLYNLVIQITDVLIGLLVQGENWGPRDACGGGYDHTLG